MFITPKSSLVGMNKLLHLADGGHHFSLISSLLMFYHIIPFECTSLFLTPETMAETTIPKRSCISHNNNYIHIAHPQRDRTEN